MKSPTNLTLQAILATVLLAGTSAAWAGTAAGTRITNQATATYLDSTLAVRTATSNTVVTTVQQVGSVSLSAGVAKNAAASAQAVYAHTLTNSGNGADTFALSATNGGVFTMAGVVFYADADGNGVADNATPVTSTGNLAAGATFRFVAVAALPAGLANGSTNNLVVTATSGFDATATATATDTTTVAGGAGVDITANTAGANAQGAGPGAEAAAVDTKSIAAGATARFTLWLSNAGGSPDTFSLDASVDAGFATAGLPDGWSLVFKDAAGSVITSATVAAGGNKVVYAEVTAPASAAAGTTAIYFRATSPGSGATDTIHDAVTVGAAGMLTLAKAQALDANCDGDPDTAFSSAEITSGAVPGACIRYQITATNSGAADIGAVVISDNIPAYTTYHAGRAASTTLGTLLAPLANAVGVVQATVGLLGPGQSASMSFGVRISQ